MLIDSSRSSDACCGLGVGGQVVAEEGSSCVVRITLPEETQPLVRGCENSPGVDMLDILRPPKGGHLGDIGGTHSNQSKGSWGGGGGHQRNVKRLNDEFQFRLVSRNKSAPRDG